MRHSSGDTVPETGVGSVSFTEVMTLREFGRRLGLAQQACSDAQHRGLRTILFGRTKFVLGQDVIAWFRRLTEEQESKGRDAELPGRLAN